jgi:hypothetical protein
MLCNKECLAVHLANGGKMYANVIRNALKITAVCAVALPCGAYANQLGTNYSPYYPLYNNGAYGASGEADAFQPVEVRPG